jgi:hypothetical protein
VVLGFLVHHPLQDYIDFLPHPVIISQTQSNSHAALAAIACPLEAKRPHEHDPPTWNQGCGQSQKPDRVQPFALPEDF